MRGRRVFLAALFASSCLPARPGILAAQGAFELKEEQRQDRVAEGDVISISLFPSEEYSREVTVQPDGTIQMPLIGVVRVRGLSIEELQSLIARRYSRYVSNPQVTANIQRFAGRRVSIIGMINKAGYYDYRDGMRLLEVVSLAGGLSPDARSSRVRILRRDVKGERSFTVNFQAVLDGDLERDPLLLPGDTIYVPKQTFTEGASWVNRNILPWAIIVSMIANVMVATRR